MKYVLPIFTGVLMGVILGVTIVLLGIEATPLQTGVLVGIAVLASTVINGIEVRILQYVEKKKYDKLNEKIKKAIDD